MKFYTVNVEATIDGESKIDARNHLISEVLKIKGVSSAGMTDEDIKKSKKRAKEAHKKL